MYDLNNCDTRYLFLNSSNATNYQPWDFTFVFNNSTAQNFFRCGDDEIVKITPMNAVIPNDWDEIDSTNNTFKIILPSQTGTYQYTISLPNSSPSILGLVQLLNNAFTATTFNYWTGSAVATLTITSAFSTLYNVLTFTLSATPSSVSIDFLVNNSAYQLLGFTKATYTYNGVNTFSSDFCPDISRLDSIYIYSSIVQENFTQYSNDNYSNLDNVQLLFSFAITASTGSNVIFENQNNAFQQIIRNNIDRLDIQIRDKAGNYVYTNSPSTFVFKIEKQKGDKAIQEVKQNRVLGLIYP